MSWLLSILLRWMLGYMCPFQLWFPQSICPVVGLLCHLVVLFPSFLKNLDTVLHNDCLSLHSHQQCKKVPLSLWRLKNWCFWTVVLEKTLESPVDCKEMQAVNPKWNQPWIFPRRTDAEAEMPTLWPPEAKSQLNGKDPDARKDCRQEEKGATEDEVVG